MATGDLDLVVESGLKRHDFDALVPVVRGAGGRIIAAASKALYD